VRGVAHLGSSSPHPPRDHMQSAATATIGLYPGMQGAPGGTPLPLHVTPRRLVCAGGPDLDSLVDDGGVRLVALRRLGQRAREGRLQYAILGVGHLDAVEEVAQQSREQARVVLNKLGHVHVAAQHAVRGRRWKGRVRGSGELRQVPTPRTK